MWELEARKQCVMITATNGEFSQFDQALKPSLIGIGAVASLGVYSALNFCGAPVFLMYGVVQGLNQSLPHGIIPQLFGALLGRGILFSAAIQGAKWLQYAPVLSAGYFCGAFWSGSQHLLCIGLTYSSSKAVLQTAVLNVA